MPSEKEPVVPVSLRARGSDELVIEWSDSQRRVYRWSELRENCPCATCREKRSQPAQLLPVISAEEAQPPRPTSMKPVGNYAYNIEWSDGHSSGIYSFTLLRQLGRVEEGPGE